LENQFTKRDSSARGGEGVRSREGDELEERARWKKKKKRENEERNKKKPWPKGYKKKGASHVDALLYNKDVNLIDAPVHVDLKGGNIGWCLSIQ
jgi:hypothetical protein